MRRGPVLEEQGGGVGHPSAGRDAGAERGVVDLADDPVGPHVDAVAEQDGHHVGRRSGDAQCLVVPEPGDAGASQPDPAVQADGATGAVRRDEAGGQDA